MNLATDCFAATAVCGGYGCCNDLLIWPKPEGKTFPLDVIIWYLSFVLFFLKIILLSDASRLCLYAHLECSIRPQDGGVSTLVVPVVQESCSHYVEWQKCDIGATILVSLR